MEECGHGGGYVTIWPDLTSLWGGGQSRCGGRGNLVGGLYIWAVTKKNIEHCLARDLLRGGSVGTMQGWRILERW